MSGRPEPAEWSGGEYDVRFPDGTPLLVDGRLQAGVRDISSVARPDTRRPKARHAVIAYAGLLAAACNPGVSICPPTASAAGIQATARCRRPGCSRLFQEAERSPRDKAAAPRPPVKLANTSALGTYKSTWTSADGKEMAVTWGEGMDRPMAFRADVPADIVRPERFGWKTPKKPADFRRFAQAFADEWEAGWDDDELEEFKAGADD